MKSYEVMATVLLALVIIVPSVAVMDIPSDLQANNLIKNPAVNQGNSSGPYNFTQGVKYWEGNGTNITYEWKGKKSLFVLYNCSTHEVIGDGKWVPERFPVEENKEYVAAVHYQSGIPARFFVSFSRSSYKDAPQWDQSVVLPATYSEYDGPLPGDKSYQWSQRVNFRVPVGHGYDRATIYVSIPGDTLNPNPTHYGTASVNYFYFGPQIERRMFPVGSSTQKEITLNEDLPESVEV
jgi:hypothetical protein